MPKVFTELSSHNNTNNEIFLTIQTMKSFLTALANWTINESFTAKWSNTLRNCLTNSRNASGVCLNSWRNVAASCLKDSCNINNYPQYCITLTVLPDIRKMLSVIMIQQLKTSLLTKQVYFNTTIPPNKILRYITGAI